MNFKRVTLPLLIIVIVIGLVSAVFSYRKMSQLKADPNAIAKEEAIKLAETVSKIIVLPEGEIPTVVTVADPSKLKGQPFFEKAKVGDKVLLYAGARKAYLYDPNANRVLEVGPINMTDNMNSSN